jgi:hypothetical protein
MTSMSSVSAQIESRRLHLGEDFLLEGACACRPRCANSMARRQKTVGNSDAKVRRERLHRYNTYTFIQRVMQTQSCLVAVPEMAEADVLIAPTISAPGMSAKDEQEQAIQACYEAAHAALLRVRPALAKSSDPLVSPCIELK